MNFFEEWKRNLENVKYIYAFLAEKDYVNETFLHGSPWEVQQACEVLVGIPLERFLDCICRFQPKGDFSKADVPIFSNFERSVIRVPELLSFAPEGLTFSELGYQLMQCANEVAQKKYGENQSKLAALCGVVAIGNERPRVVRLTALGRYLVPLPPEEKMAVFQRMVLRNGYLQYFIHEVAGSKDSISYKETVSCLAPSNQKRRGPNVHYLMNFIFKGSKRKSVLQRIDWKV